MMRRHLFFSVVLGGIVGFGSALVADSHCPADVDGDNAVDVIDLLEVISQWGDCGEANDGNDLVWTITSHSNLQPNQGTSVQIDDGTGVQIHDKNGGQWDNFSFYNLNLLTGPTSSTDILRVSMTVDFSEMQGKDGAVNPNFYLTGYYGGSATPLNTSSSLGHWYYADAYDAPVGENGTSWCADSAVHVAELDLFECGSSATISGGLPTVMQITPHPPGGGTGSGNYVGIGNTSDYSVASQGICGPIDGTLSIEGTSNTYLGMDISQPFSLVYEISSTQIKLSASQGSTTSNVTYTPSTSNWSASDWTKFQYFAPNLGVNNSYFGGQDNCLTPSTEYGSEYGSWLATGILFEVSTDGGTTHTPALLWKTGPARTSGIHLTAVSRGGHCRPTTSPLPDPDHPSDPNPAPL